MSGFIPQPLTLSCLGIIPALICWKATASVVWKMATTKVPLFSPPLQILLLCRSTPSVKLICKKMHLFKRQNRKSCRLIKAPSSKSIIVQRPWLTASEATKDFLLHQLHTQSNLYGDTLFAPSCQRYLNFGKAYLYNTHLNA